MTRLKSLQGIMPDRAAGIRLRRRYATYIEEAAGETPEDLGRPRFPMPDRPHARNALARLGQASGLTAAQKRFVAQRAANVMGRVTPGARRYGVRRLTRPPTAALRQGPVLIPRGERRAARRVARNRRRA